MIEKKDRMAGVLPTEGLPDSAQEKTEEVRNCTDGCAFYRTGDSEGDENCEFCPAFKAGKSCWEFDWESVFNGVKNPQTIEVWRSYMRSHCLECKCYKEHKDTMEPMFERMGVLITPLEVEEQQDKKVDADLFSFG